MVVGDVHIESERSEEIILVRSDAYYVREGAGVRLTNRDGTFTLSGDGAYGLVEALFNGLENPCRLSDLCRGLTPQAAASVERLVDLLKDRGVVRGRHDADDDILPPWQAERYAGQIALLDREGDYPVRRFLRARATPVHCIGRGPLLRAVLSALADFGFRDVTVTTPGPEIVGVRQLVRDVTERDAEMWWAVHDAGAVAIVEPKDGAHIILAGAMQDDDVGSAPGRDHARHVLAAVGDVLVAMPHADGADGVRGCWRCLQLGPLGSASHCPQDAPGEVAATLGALNLAQEIFLSTADGTVRQRTVTVDCSAPIVRSHKTLRHPVCREHASVVIGDHHPTHVYGPVRPDIGSAEDPALLTEEYDRIVQATRHLTDALVGPLFYVGESDDDQVPLASSTCRITDPLVSGDRGGRAFRCLGIAPRETRSQVVLQALEWAAQSVLGRHDASRPVIVAAGWSRDEALWRLALRAATGGGPTQAWRPVHMADELPCGRFLREALAAEGAEVVAAEAAPTSVDGVAIARLRLASGSVIRGVGRGVAHAVAQAELSALVECIPGRSSAALLAPEGDAWSDLTGAFAPRGLMDVTRCLPWVDGSVHLIAVPVERRRTV
ncbi:hypothetical protein [Kocuria sp. CPCC 205297]|uniref:hypothetical protein n=1 Tax=Kocuria sp. CPCC 205297 TaxID=3073558 RepID=UPI0034D7884A